MARPVDLSRYGGTRGSATAQDAQQMLDRGDLDAAASVIAVLVASQPGEATTWFAQARLLAARGQSAHAQEACRRALALWPDILPVWRLFSDLAETLGNAPEGLDACRRMLLANEPGDAVLANRIGASLCAKGLFLEALPTLRIAAPVLGHQDSALWNYATALAVTGGYHELLGFEPVLVEFARGLREPFSPFVHLVAAKLALRFDRQAVLRESAARQRSASWLDTASLAACLREAIACRQPFSLLLLAHGHARLVTYGGLHNHLAFSREEMSAVVNSVWTDAFGAVIEANGAAPAAAVIRDLCAAIADADVVALPGCDVLALEHEHFGYLAEMQRLVLGRRSELCAGPEAIRELHEAMPFLRPLLAEQPFLGFVGSNRDLAEKLRHFCQVGETVTYLVPGPQQRRDNYPAGFEKTLAVLQVPRPGAVFLVAAGLLGPIYCNRIKQLGGIAIDIESVLARWTRC
ncbi:hypothetical protein [Lichenicoccus sp.]|uniref:hypothetical protein n=1 Tax=Lichenicoccus sp. TaxID=2781899 RepID=UPI003D109AAF